MSTIECQLKLILNSTTLRVTSIVPIADPASKQSFEKKYSSTRTIHTFLHASTVISKNTSTCSVEVPVYSVPINLNELQHKVYYAEVAVGNTLYVSKEYGTMSDPPSGYDSFLICTGLKHNENSIKHSQNQKNSNDDSEYRLRGSGDSITYEYLKESNKNKKCVSEEELRRSLRNMDDRFTYGGTKEKLLNNEENENIKIMSKHTRTVKDAETNDNVSVVSHSSKSSSLSATVITEENINFDTLFYLIKDPTKINILHEVHFDYDQALENGKDKCENCKENPSIMFCIAERASFCKKCDEEFHSNHFTQRHQMFYYDSLKKKKQFLQCPFHPENVSDYFCEECGILLCSVCKISGSHANPPFSNHKIVKFLEACDKISEKMKNEEKDLDEKINNLETQIKVFTNTVTTDFLSNITIIRNKIENEYRSAMNELNAIVRKKYQVINAKFIEQRVCLERCVRMKKYIEELDEGQSVKDYKAIQEQKYEMKLKEIRVHVGNEKVVMKGYISIYAENENEPGKREVYTESKGRPRQNKY